MMLKPLDIVGIILVVVSIPLIWRYKRSWLKTIAYRFVINAEESLLGPKRGIQKIILVKNRVRSWFYERSVILGFIFEALITDKDIEKAVGQVLKETKEEFELIEDTRESVASFVVQDINARLKQLNLDSKTQDKITQVLATAEKQVVNDRGYIQAFAKYNEKEKFSAGVEAGIKF